MSNANWRGIVGVVKPTYKSGSLVDFIRLLPDGVGVVPLFIGAQEHTEDEYLRAPAQLRQRPPGQVSRSCRIANKKQQAREWDYFAEAKLL